MYLMSEGQRSFRILNNYRYYEVIYVLNSPKVKHTLGAAIVLLRFKILLGSPAHLQASFVPRQQNVNRLRVEFLQSAAALGSDERMLAHARHPHGCISSPPSA